MSSSTRLWQPAIGQAPGFDGEGRPCWPCTLDRPRACYGRRPGRPPPPRPRSTSAATSCRSSRTSASGATGPTPGPARRICRLDLRREQRSARRIRVIVPGHCDESELIVRIKSTDADEMMPPPKSNLTLNAREVAILERWVSPRGRVGQALGVRLARRQAVPQTKPSRPRPQRDRPPRPRPARTRGLVPRPRRRPRKP